MHKYIFLIFFTLLFFNVNGQNLVYKSGSRIYDSDNKRLSSKEVEKILSADVNSLRLYKKGMEKKTLGNILLYGGLGAMVLDLGGAAYNGNEYPTALTIAGAVAVAVSIPVKIGFSKRIKKSVEDYNNLHPATAVGYTATLIKQFDFIAGASGFGIRLTLD